MFGLHKHKKENREVIFIEETDFIIVDDEHYCKHNHANKTRLILTTSINNSIYQIMSISLAANQKVLGTLTLIDNVTGQPVAATFTTTVATSDNTAALTASVDPNGEVVGTGVAEGTGNITTTTEAAYTNSLGVAVSESKTETVPFTVTAVATANGTNLVVNFGAPVAQ